MPGTRKRVRRATSGDGGTSTAGTDSAASRKRVRRRVASDKGAASTEGTATTTGSKKRKKRRVRTDGTGTATEPSAAGASRKKKRVRKSAYSSASESKGDTTADAGSGKKKTKRRRRSEPTTAESTAGASTAGSRKKRRVRTTEPVSTTAPTKKKSKKRVRKPTSDAISGESSADATSAASTASGKRKKRRVRTAPVPSGSSSSASPPPAAAASSEKKKKKKKSTKRKRKGSKGSKGTKRKGTKRKGSKRKGKGKGKRKGSSKKAKEGSAETSASAAVYSDSDSDPTLFGLNASIRAGEGSSGDSLGSDDEDSPPPKKGKKSKRSKRGSDSSSSSGRGRSAPTQVAPNVFLVPMNDAGASYLSTTGTRYSTLSGPPIVRPAPRRAAGSSSAGSTATTAGPGYEEYETLLAELNVLAGQMGTFGSELSRRKRASAKRKSKRSKHNKKKKQAVKGVGPKIKGSSLKGRTGSASSSAASPASASSSGSSDAVSGEEVTKFPGKSAVLVTDMSGFTRLTRKHGIVHYASLIMTMRALLTPAFEALGASAIETEADDFFVVFPDVVSAVRAAFLVRDITTAYNEGKEEDYQIAIGGMGIGFGAGLVRDDLTGKLHGPPMVRGFKLGENTAEDGEILIDEPGQRALAASSKVTGLDYEAREIEGSDDSAFKYSVVLGRPLPRGKYDAHAPLELPPAPKASAEDAEYFKAQALRRLAFPKARSAIDGKLAERFIRAATVVMLGADYGTVGSAAAALRLEQAVYHVCQPIVAEHGGTMEEGALWVFDRPDAAVHAALRIQHAIAEMEEEVPLLGFGIHTGPLLVVPGTNVHWGDPVNTASKLGEDLAKDGEIYISGAVRDAISESAVEGGCKFDASTAVVSKVEIDCFRVTRIKKSMLDAPKGRKGAGKAGSTKKKGTKKGTKKKGSKKGTKKKGTKKGTKKKGTKKGTKKKGAKKGGK